MKEPIRLCTIVRSFEGTETTSRRMPNNESTNIENHLTCFYVQLNAADRSLLVSTSEHSLLDELRRDFKRPIDTFVHLPLSEQFFHTRSWNHIAVVMKKSLLKSSEVEIYINGRCLTTNKLNYITANVGGGHAQFGEGQAVHAIIGTPPYLRKAAGLRWRVASVHLIEEPLPIDLIRKIFLIQPHYIGNYQVYLLNACTWTNSNSDRD